MLLSQRPWLAHKSWAWYRVIMPALAGTLLLLSSLLPWLTNPSGQRLIAWQLPVDLGWQLRSGVFNYGLLCLCAAGYAFFVAYKARQLVLQEPGTLSSQDSTHQHALLRRNYRRAAVLALIPASLLVWQLLLVDMHTIADLTRGQLELQLTKSHFGYNYDAMFVPILQAGTFNPLHIGARFSLFADRVFFGFFVSLLSAITLLIACPLLPVRRRNPAQERPRNRVRTAIIVAAAVLGVVILGRGPAALVCNNKAEQLLSSGDYQKALQWLDSAQFLNPSLDELSAFHIQRGQALYYLNPGQATAESKTYLANYYRQQNDLLSAYQEINNAWQNYPHTLWMRDEVTQSLVSLIELNKPLKGAQKVRLDGENRSITWLHKLLELDPQNVYAHLTLGRILYDLDDYDGTQKQMQQIIAITDHPEIKSAAYTYIALSKIGLGDPITARDYLFKAQELDPEFRNNTARQNLSGMR